MYTILRHVDWKLKEWKTDYLDYCFIHCLDEASDWREYQEKVVLVYLLEM